MGKRGGLKPRKSDNSTEHLYRSKWNHGKTKTVRVPIALEEKALKIIKALDEGKTIEIKPKQLYQKIPHTLLE